MSFPAWSPVGRRLWAPMLRQPSNAGSANRPVGMYGPAVGDSTRESHAAPIITAVSLDRDVLVLDFFGVPPSPVRLVGPRESVEATVVTNRSGGARARLPLVGTRWGLGGLCLPSGAYRLQFGQQAADQVITEPDELPTLLDPLFRCDIKADSGGLTVRIAPPLTADERLPTPHRDHRQVYLRGRSQPENAVYFESFYGSSATCNPAGIDRALRTMRPDVTRYWSVADGSKYVPDGAIRIVEGSDEWWRVRAEARVYVINDWLRWTFFRRPYQHVLQTWHGTMLKRLALDRPNVSLRRRSAVIRQQARWDALLSQNCYSSAIFRRAYAARCPIWEIGYPRNDVFADEARGNAVRAAIGIPEGVRTVLYAPTWRDDRLEIVNHLDLAAMAAALPPDHMLLVRGHSRTLAHGGDLRGDRMIDVTSYPDMSDLMTATDVLVTDYSSAMFDFAGTGKPMIFYTPDLEHYSETLRGFYFDLLDNAPGPVVTTQGDLLDAIADIDALARAHAPAYELWRARFVPSDDGHAGERAVQRMLDQGWLL